VKDDRPVEGGGASYWLGRLARSPGTGGDALLSGGGRGHEVGGEK